MNITRWLCLAVAAAVGSPVGGAAASVPPGAAPVPPEPITADVLTDTVFEWAVAASQNDVFATLAAFGMPAVKGVPMPTGGQLVSMLVSVWGEPGSFSATVGFLTDTPLTEGVPAFEAAMAANGFELRHRGDLFQRAEYMAQSVEFALSGGTPDDVAISTHFRHAPPGPDLVDVAHSARFEPDVPGLTAWLEGIPLVDTADSLVTWGVSSGTDPDDLNIVVSAELRFEMTGLDLAELFPTALANSPLTVDPDAESVRNTYILLGSEFDELVVVVHPRGGPGRMNITGTIDLPG